MGIGETAESLPTQPGVYLFKGDKDRVLYVGKDDEAGFVLQYELGIDWIDDAVLVHVADRVARSRRDDRRVR